jgi:hypothetical protein
MAFIKRLKHWGVCAGYGCMDMFLCLTELLTSDENGTDEIQANLKSTIVKIWIYCIQNLFIIFQLISQNNMIGCEIHLKQIHVL